MVKENVEIAFRATGIPIIKRNIDELGMAANRATRGVFLLQRAIFTLGGFGLARALTQSLDALTNMENRLRLTTSSTQQLEAVQRELFAIANRSRSSWEGVSEIYNRAALSAKALGISQKDVLAFTEGVSKAAVVSGAGAQEARAALIQLGQAVASNRLGGDELRSVLEQLPMAADVIANYMTSLGTFGTVTRGNIRDLGRQGKITAEIMIEAFKFASADLDKLFANMPLTIGQAVEQMRTQWMVFLDEFDDAYNISGFVASAIKLVADNLMLIAQTAMFAAGAMATLFVGKTLSSIGTFISGVRQAAVMINSLRAAKTAMAAADVVAAQRDVAANAIRQATLAQNVALIGQQKVLLQQEVLNAQYSVVNGRARNIQTGHFVNLGLAKANLIRLTNQLNIVEGVEAAQAARLAGARAGQAVATTALAGATTRLAGAQAAQATLGARLALQFPLIAGGARMVSSAVASLWGIIAANPITALIAVVGLLTYAFYQWGNEIKVTSDGIVGLKDYVIAAFQIIWEYIGPWVTNFLSAIFKLVRDIKSAFSNMAPPVIQTFVNMVTGIADTVFIIPRTIIAVVAGIIAAWDVLPAAAGSMAIEVANAVIAGFEAMANFAIDKINEIIAALNFLQSVSPSGMVGGLLGFTAEIPMIPKATLSKIPNTYAGAGKNAATSFSDGFAESFESTSSKKIIGSALGALAPINSAIEGRARQNLQDARADAALIAAANAAALAGQPGTPVPGSNGGGGGGGGANAADFAAELEKLTKQIELEKQWGIQKEANNNIMKIEEAIKRELNASEEEQVINATRLLEIAKQEGAILESLNGAQEKLAITQEALNNLFKQGEITAGQYADKLREVQVAALRAEGTFSGGLQAALMQSVDTVSSLGEAFGDRIVSGIESASDALVDFVVDGKGSFSDLISSMLRDLAKLAAQSAFKSLFSNLFGKDSPLSNLFAGFFDTGGYIPSGRFGIVGERGPEIVSGPSQVTSRSETSRMMNKGSTSEIVLRIISDDKVTIEEATQIATGVSMRVMSSGLKSSRKTMMSAIAEDQDRGV